jgi:hypothetical protein
LAYRSLIDAQPPYFQPVIYWLLPNPSAQLMQLTVGTQPPDFQPVVHWLLPDSLSRLIAALVGTQPSDFQPVMYWLLPDFLSQLIAALVGTQLLISSQPCIDCCLIPYLGLSLPWLVPNLLISSQSCIHPQFGSKRKIV